MKFTGKCSIIFLFFFTTAMFTSLFHVSPAQAATDSIVSELRIGWLAHDVHAFSFNREDGTDINAEILFKPFPYDWIKVIGSPRPHIGTSLNTAGHTSQVYAGFTWQLILPKDFFFEAMLGGSAHNGNRNLESVDRKSLGLNYLFRLGAAVGYNITDHINISVMFDHVSNAGLNDANEGLENLGVRLGYRF